MQIKPMSAIIQETENYVSQLLAIKLKPSYLYHNLRHTQRVVKSATELLDFYQLDADDREAVILAAWLHDVGYTVSNENHEKESCTLATAFLKSQNYSDEGISTVCSLIMSTDCKNTPETLGQKILMDADCSHFAKKSFVETSEMLRQEWEKQGIKSFTEVEWIEENIKFFTQNHQFQTDYAIKNWQGEKEKNLAKLFSLLKKERKSAKNSAKKEKELSLKVDKARLPERGIETMFRVTLRNHIKLSDIADTKANILLSVNAIIISLVLANLIPKLDNPSNTYLIYPTIVFLIFSIISMILSILATRPNITSGEFSKKDVEDKKVNLLFFGNFHKMKLEDFEWAMGEMMQDKDYLYASMTKDLYFLGKVLNKKYKILRTTYTIFMVGMVLSVIAFAIAFRIGADRVM